ncbi:Pr6Pr family membrane protein [Pseudokineococcus basanitobsidens]|uniref:Pr6Pr family membrane protein n=1 Tax=Pseudokineococcus basanitobsidens TaxID=1926649 RepID=A0ABU8RFG7_9ACTN
MDRTTAGTSRPPARTTHGLSRAWHLGLAVVVGASLLLQLVLVLAGGTDASSTSGDEGAPLGVRLVRLASYFTIQSNVLVLVAAVSLARDPARDGPVWRVLRLDALLGISVTGLVFGAVLSAQVDPTGAAWWANAGLHRVSPVACVVGWLLLGPRPRVDGRTLLGAAAWPVAWIAYTFGHGALTGWYPYPFLDAGERGYPAALLATLLVVVLAVVLGAAAALLDARLRPRPGAGRGTRSSAATAG